jgi:Tfp pilus assembly protein PilV
MKNLERKPAPQSKVKGFALVEVLISFVVLSGGLLAIFNFNSTAQKNNAEAKTAAEAVAIGEQKLHELESFLSSDDTRLDTGTYADRANGTSTNFTRNWVVTTDVDDPTQKLAQVTVTWIDRDGNSQSVVMASEISFETPSRGVERMLAVVDLAKQVSDFNVWGGGVLPNPDPDPNPDSDPDPNPTPDPDPDPDPTPDPGPDLDPDPDPSATYEIVVSSSLSIGGGGTRLDGITVSGNNYDVTCSNSASSWTCPASDVLVGDTLSFTVSFITNKWACVPSNQSGYGAYSFASLSSDISSGYDVVLSKGSGFC